jgi:hypothetical protein
MGHPTICELVCGHNSTSSLSFFQLDKLKPRRRPWKIDYAGGSPESDIVVVINFLFGHVDDEETAGILALVVLRHWRLLDYVL